MQRVFVIKPLLQFGLILIGLNQAIFLLATSSGIVPSDFYVEETEGPITWFHILMASIVPALVGYLMAYLCFRFLDSGKIVFTSISVLFGILSCLGPVGIPDAPLSLMVLLILLHITTGGLITLAGRNAMTEI
ncbi:MAG: hypothetical protein K1X56_08105 [Flavobacteriales bacterium]|nr:hypothetical protein [Flavobacteriales bacterium]